MTAPKTPEEIAIMEEGGSKLGSILQTLLDESKPGVDLLDIEKHAMDLISKAGGTPSFTTVEDYRWATCLCVNEQVVHGIPRKYLLKEGDVFTIDIGMLYKGYHTDTAWSIIIKSQTSKGKNQNDEINEVFLRVGEKALEKAIAAARPGNRIGNISKVIEDTIKSSGYHVVKSLTGHAVGRKLHEEPFVPEYLTGKVERTPILTAGMTLALEVIYAAGNGSIVYETGDGWTLSSKDRSLTAVFEHSIAILENKTLVLTKRPN